MVACDLGSNTFRVVEIDCKTKKRVKEFERVVKTAENLANCGEISKEAVYRIVLAIDEAKKIFDLSSAKAVATAALRKATNSEEVLETILQKTGLKIEIIDAKCEANYVRKAVEAYVCKDYIILDLGGGSTELILKDVDSSFDVGIVTLTDRYDDIKQGIEKEFKPIKKFANSIKKPKTFVATAGTPTTVAAFLQGLNYNSYDYKKINGTILTLSMIDDVLLRLLNMSEVERIKWVGVGRDDLIIAGIMMFVEIVKMFGFDEVLVIDDGVREGVALSECDSASSYIN